MESLDSTMQPNMYKKRSSTSRVLAAALGSWLALTGVARAEIDPVIEEQLLKLQDALAQIQFDMDRVNSPPDHEVARNVASASICASLNLDGSLSGTHSRTFQLKGVTRGDPSVGAVVVVKGDAKVTLTPDTSISGGIGTALRLCMDIMPWAQFAYYLMIDQDPEKEFWEDSPMTFSERVFGASKGSGDLYANFSQPAADFLGTLGAVVMGGAGGIPESPLIKGTVETTEGLFQAVGGGVTDLSEAVLANVGGLDDFIENQILNMGLSPMQATNDVLTSIGTELPFLPDLTNILDDLDSISMDDLNPCAMAGMPGMPGALGAVLDTACNGVGQAIAFNAQVASEARALFDKQNDIETHIDFATDKANQVANDIQGGILDGIDSVNFTVTSTTAGIKGAVDGVISGMQGLYDLYLVSFFTDTIPSKFSQISSWLRD